MEQYRAVAQKRGDTFHVLYSNPRPTHKPGLWPKRELIRNGDSFITCDGYAPYHERNVEATLELLRTYDVIMTSFLCPHPTKQYGTEPLFLPFFEKIKKLGKPFIGYVHDAYWDTYKEWGELTLPFCVKTLIAQKAYGNPLVKAGYKVQPVYLPFTPLVTDPKVKRDAKRLVWTPQWKNIKGVQGFFKGLPALKKAGFNVGLYNSGIEYFKFRLEEPWRQVVDADYHVNPETVNRRGKMPQVAFHGWQPLENVPGILAGAGFMADFQGHSAKYSAYLNGSYNCTIIEALYYGTVPVVHANMLKGDIPAELLLAVNQIAEYPEAVRRYTVGSYPATRAREFVLDCHSAEKLYDKIFKEFAPGKPKGVKPGRASQTKSAASAKLGRKKL
jgi:hypothetical protein